MVNIGACAVRMYQALSPPPLKKGPGYEANYVYTWLGHTQMPSGRDFFVPSIIRPLQFNYMFLGLPLKLNRVGRSA